MGTEERTERGGAGPAVPTREFRRFIRRPVKEAPKSKALGFLGSVGDSATGLGAHRKVFGRFLGGPMKEAKKGWGEIALDLHKGTQAIAQKIIPGAAQKKCFGTSFGALLVLTVAISPCLFCLGRAGWKVFLFVHESNLHASERLAAKRAAIEAEKARRAQEVPQRPGVAPGHAQANLEEKQP